MQNYGDYRTEFKVRLFISISEKIIRMMIGLYRMFYDHSVYVCTPPNDITCISIA